MSKLQRLHADHAPAVLAFEVANRAYFSGFISDRGDEFFDQFSNRYSALLGEQEAGVCAFYLLIAEDGSIPGRWNRGRRLPGRAGRRGPWRGDGCSALALSTGG